MLPAPPESEKPRRQSPYLRLLPDTPYEDLQGPGVPLFSASASMVKDFERCARYGYQRHRNGLATESGAAADTGTMLHGQWEQYSKHGTAPTDPRAIGALSFLPPPGATGVVVERAFQFPSPLPGVTWTGHWDLYDGRDPNNHVVTDHKSTSDFKYAKAPHELQTDPQMVLYAQATDPAHAAETQECPDCRGSGKRWERDGLTQHSSCEGCQSTGRLAPLTLLGVKPRLPDSSVTVRHLVTLTKAIKTGRPAREVAFTFNPETLAEAYARLNATLAHIAKNIWPTPHWEQVEPTWGDPCDAYGGCPFLSYCQEHLSRSEGPAAVVWQALSLLDFTTATQPEEEPIMTTPVTARLDRLAQGIVPPDAAAPVTRIPGQVQQMALAPPPPPAAWTPQPAPLSVAAWGMPVDAQIMRQADGSWTAWADVPQGRAIGNGPDEATARTRLVAALCEKVPQPATLPPPPPPAAAAAPPPPLPPTAPAPASTEVSIKNADGHYHMGKATQREDGTWEGVMDNGITRTAPNLEGLKQVLDVAINGAPAAPTPDKPKKEKKVKAPASPVVPPPPDEPGLVRVQLHGRTVEIWRAVDGWCAQATLGALTIRLPGHEGCDAARDAMSARLQEMDAAEKVRADDVALALKATTMLGVSPAEQEFRDATVAFMRAHAVSILAQKRAEAAEKAFREELARGC